MRANLSSTTTGFRKKKDDRERRQINEQQTHRAKIIHTSKQRIISNESEKESTDEEH